MKTWALSIVGVVLIVWLAISFIQPFNSSHPSNNLSNNQVKSLPVNNISATPVNSLVAPIANAKVRMTKKPFGIYITPETSPIQPEKFTGYHTGVDFETFPNEQAIDVPIYAVCPGKLLVKRTASGYGGIAVQSCQLDGQDVAVLYGHMRLASINVIAGQMLKAGEQLGVLGTGYSQETSGERKHLHLGVYKSTTINVLGYVQKQSDLNQWLNAADYL